MNIDPAARYHADGTEGELPDGDAAAQEAIRCRFAAGEGSVVEEGCVGIFDGATRLIRAGERSCHAWCLS